MEVVRSIGDDIMRCIAVIFTLDDESEERLKKINGWNKAVKYSFEWAKDE